MVLDSRGADGQDIRNLGVVQALDEQPQDFKLALGQVVAGRGGLRGGVDQDACRLGERLAAGAGGRIAAARLAASMSFSR